MNVTHSGTILTASEEPHDIVKLGPTFICSKCGQDSTTADTIPHRPGCPAATGHEPAKILPAASC